MWFISEFSQLIFLAAFVSFQVNSLVAKEKLLHHLDPMLTSELSICRTDQVSHIHTAESQSEARNSDHVLR